MKKEYMMMFALTVAAGVAVFFLTEKMRREQFKHEKMGVMG